MNQSQEEGNIVVQFYSLQAVVDRTAQAKIGAINKPIDLVNVMKALTNLHLATEEHLYLVALDKKRKVQGIVLLSKGTLNSALINPRELYKHLFVLNSEHFILVHNHPSGDMTPSEEDKLVSLQLSKLGKFVGIELVDHLIITDLGFTSLKNEGIV